MTFRQTLNKVQESKIFQTFIKENPEAELCAGFFILDFLSNDNKRSIDYKLGDKVFTFDLTENDEVLIKEDKLLDLPDRPKLTKINPETKIELNELKSIAGIAALDNGISAKFHKIIAVLQNNPTESEVKQIWNLTCMLDQLIILNILVDSETGKVLKFDRKSMMDMIKKK